MEEKIVRAALFSIIAVFVIVYDIKEQRIPNAVVIAGMLCALGLSLWPPARIVSSLLGAATGFSVLWCIWYLSKGKIGMGDAKYSAVIGAMVGPRGWCIAILVGSLAGLIFGLVMILKDRSAAGKKIPLGPFLSLGGIAALLAAIFQWPPLLTAGAS